MSYRVVTPAGESVAYPTLKEARASAIAHAEQMVRVEGIKADGLSVWVHDENDVIVGSATLRMGVEWNDV